MIEHSYGGDELEVLLVGDAHTKKHRSSICFSSFMST